MPAYMKLGDIKGEAAAASDATHGGGGGAGKVSVHDISLARAAGDVAAEGDAAAGLDHGVTVLAWARVDGTSVSDPFEPTFRGGVVVGATDDVWIDGRIITGENPAAAGTGGGPHVKVLDGTAAMDGDGDIDGGDFLIWQRGGSPSAGGDDDLLIGGLTVFDGAADGTLPSEQLSLNYTKVVWTYDQAAESGHSGGVNMAFGDGSVRFVSDDLGLL